MSEVKQVVEHKGPAGDCVICCEDLTKANYAEYRAKSDQRWHPAPYCETCIAQFIQNQWKQYIDAITKADCAAALRRVLAHPPPINVKDAGFPECKDNGNNDEVHSFWYSSNGKEASAKLKDSLEGEARETFWAEKKAFLTATEHQEELAKKDKTDKEKEKEKDTETEDK